MVIDERNNFQDEFPNNIASPLKPLYFILCPAFIDVFMLGDLKWGTVLPFPCPPSLKIGSGSSNFGDLRS